MIMLYTYTSIHMYTHIHTHTYIHTYIRMYTHICDWLWENPSVTHKVNYPEKPD